jgi:hypothetical protein
MRQSLQEEEKEAVTVLPTQMKTSISILIHTFMGSTKHHITICH